MPRNCLEDMILDATRSKLTCTEVGAVIIAIAKASGDHETKVARQCDADFIKTSENLQERNIITFSPCGYQTRFNPKNI